MVFCNFEYKGIKFDTSFGHNPYFNRWFSAIRLARIQQRTAKIVTILILIDGFLQLQEKMVKKLKKLVTILILIDGFLQF